ncbi:pentapeptide repeat-containing protein [Planobispora rosea]|uniref:pentapeptide repeat-containing protein n=1 Tax=Planobispora rosea TaxID=35762 RepID=UPI000839FA91|nr:pentapeptide repeat-containing protein [Planobispora rosea]
MPGERRAVTREELEKSARGRARLEDVAARGLDLADAWLPRLEADFLDASGADLSGANLSGAHLMDCDFIGVRCDRAGFSGATLFQCGFEDAVGESVSFSGVRSTMSQWRRAELPRAGFRQALLSHADFQGAGLEEAMFDLADGEEVVFRDARPVRASFRGAVLPGADFRGADLRDADFSLADLTGADFTGALLDGAVFGGAAIGSARFDGDPPAVEPRPPAVDRTSALREHLRRGEAQQAVELYGRRPGAWVWEALKGGGLQRAATGQLLRRLLGDDTLLVLHRACRATADLSRGEGMALDVVEELSALLASGTAVHAPEHGGQVRFTMDPGREAAFALGGLMRHPETRPAAEAALRAGLGGRAVVTERCAAGLVARLAEEDRWTEIGELLSSDRPRVHRGVVLGLERHIGDAGEIAKWEKEKRRPPSRDVRSAFALLEELCGHPDPKIAGLAQVRKRSVDWVRRYFTDVDESQA